MPLTELEPRYVISVAAKILGIETHTLRYYEKLGLIQPYRSSGHIRYYSEIDIKKLRQVKALMEDMGINVAGVEVILRMKDMMEDMQRNLEEMEEEISKLKQGELEVRNKKIKQEANLLWHK